jgi:hypothetical protein
VDFAFDTLLMHAIESEKENEGEGTEHDPTNGTSFEAVQDSTPSSSSTARASAFHIPTYPRLAPTSLPPPINSPLANMTRDLEDSFESESESGTDACGLGAQNRKRKSKSRITYKKMAFKKRHTADRQSAKDDVGVKIRPSMRERHTSAAPISVPSFSLDTKVPAQTGYVGMRDVKANKRVYKLHELVGDGSKFKFNLVEWDGE